MEVSVLSDKQKATVKHLPFFDKNADDKTFNAKNILFNNA